MRITKPAEPMWLADIGEREDAIRKHIYTAWHKGNGHGVWEPFLHDRAWVDAGLSLLVTTGTVFRHSDSDELPRWSYHAVLINDGYIARNTGLKRNWALQRPGCIVELDIYETHALEIDTRLGHSPQCYPGWASLCFNVHERISDANILHDRFSKSRTLAFD